MSPLLTFDTVVVSLAAVSVGALYFFCRKTILAQHSTITHLAEQIEIGNNTINYLLCKMEDNGVRMEEFDVLAISAMGAKVMVRDE